jgi:hypothetical protein
MRFLHAIFLLALATTIEAKTVYFNGEDGRVDQWLAQESGVARNIYNQDIDSRVVSLPAGTYDLGIGNRSWNNETERVLSWDMNITGGYTIFVSVDTTQGHRWLFYNDLNVHVGFHGTGILNGFGGPQSHNGTWQKVVIDLDRELKDTEPNNNIIRVNGIRFAGNLGMIDNVMLDTPRRRGYEDGNSGVSNWHITDNTPAGATITNINDDESVTLRDKSGTPFQYAYNDNVISLNGHNEDNAFTIGAESGDDSWNNQEDTILQWKMRNNNNFTVIVHILTANGTRELTYTPTRNDNGLVNGGTEIHHGLGKSRNGDGVPYGEGTDNRWQTFTRDLVEDLHDYDPNNRLIAINGMTIRGNTLIDDIELLSAPKDSYNYPEFQKKVYYEDAEDNTINGWQILEGNAGDITNVLDTDTNSRVIQLTGGGSYRLGNRAGQNGAWNERRFKHISWRMRTSNAYTIYVIADTTEGLRYLFYTISPNRGLRHGFENGIHHGLGDATIDGRWRTVTRDLERDLKDAEPTNDLISINGFIYNGGNGGRIDDIILFTPEETTYEDGESGTDGWVVSDNNPTGATITNIADSDRQNRHLQGNIISLRGNGADNAYRVGVSWNNSIQKIIQWRFRDFGAEPEVIDPRGIIRDPEAFEFRVHVVTTNGARDLVYTLGATNLGRIEGGSTIHHGFGDDRVRGSVWAGDNPRNELGLWQTITRDLEEDLRDFEPTNSLVSVNSFEIRNSGLVDDIKMLTNAVIYNTSTNSNIHMYEDAEDGNIDGWSIFANTSGNATVTNIMDSNRGSRVIQLQGQGKSDAYRLRSEDNHNWDEREDKSMRWSMNYNEDYTIYISVNTTNGRRYVTYTPRDDDRGLSGNYILIGLGANSDNGTWQTFTRDLQNDISQAEPSNELIAIDAFIVRGSGRFDDIQSF